MRRTRRNRLFIFAGQFRADLSWLFDTREFFSFPRASGIELFLPPCFSTSEEGERNVPDKSGRTRPSGSRRRWRKEFRSNGRKELFGEIRRSTRETRKTRERTVGSRKNESTKNVASVRSRVVMVKSGGRRECSEGIGLRSDFGRIRCGRHRKVGSLLAAKIKNDRLDKERQPLFVLVPSWLSPGGGEASRGHRIAVRLRSDSVWFAIEK